MTARSQRALAVAALLAAAWAGPAAARIDGIYGSPNGLGPEFHLVVRTGHITIPDGGSPLVWGYADADGSTGGLAQLPGPTLVVNEGDWVTVTLSNELSGPAALPVSIVFPGQDGVSAGGGAAGLLTREAAPGGGAVTYTFRATHPGTFQYHSGTRQDVEIEMGLYGALIVRPTQGGKLAYDSADTAFDRETLFVLSELDPVIHGFVDQGRLDLVDTTSWRPHYWLINGRAAPDTLGEPFAPQFPFQPYNALPRIHPGDRLLMRVVNTGRDFHPFHHHANHARIVGVDGRLLSSAPGSGADLSWLVFTVGAVPGQTVDALFSWTGEGLGWDVYGHGPGEPLQPFECPSGAASPRCDHGKPIPVALPDQLALFYGEFHSGSPFLGRTGPRQPSQWKNNSGAFYFMWHSHTEREIVNYDVFPGGMMTMLVVEAPWVPIE